MQQCFLGPRIVAPNLERAVSFSRSEVAFGTKIGRMFGAQKNVCETDIVLARHRHSNTVAEW